MHYHVTNPPPHKALDNSGLWLEITMQLVFKTL